MFETLYGESGYYSQGSVKFGARGDFFTASQVHELFGQALAREFEHQWLSEGSPSRFTILELGPGNGEFAFDAVNYIRKTNPQFYDRLAYICCEISAPLAGIQKVRLSELEEKVTWIANLTELAPFEGGVIFSNEFFDSLPVHIARQSGGRLKELYVADGAWLEGDLSDERLAALWKRAGAPLVEEQRVEICLDAIRILETLAAKCSRTLMITIDYGDVARRLYTADRCSGTLRCFRRHTISDDPFSDPGQWDITASVNFSVLIEFGEDLGFKPQELMPLARYLSSLGLLERVAELSATANLTPRERLRLMQSKQLFVEQGFGASFKVLVAYKT
jgi:SAM-dependent MidA family methyltransferase